MTLFDFENLNLYKKSLDFITIAYKQTRRFPKEELYCLTSQYRRAANSIALNIGEGYGETIPLSLRYLRITKGSIRECVVCVTVAYREGYINSDEYSKSRELLVDLSKMSVGYKKYLEKKLKQK